MNGAAAVVLIVVLAVWWRATVTREVRAIRNERPVRPLDLLEGPAPIGPIPATAKEHP